MKIGKRVKAKKYKALREKQALVNKKIKTARGRLGSSHREMEKLKAKKRTFFNKRGLRSPSQLSFKNLSTKDLQAYEEMLDSMLNDFETNTYLNEQKYNELRERLEEQFNEQYGDLPIDTDDLVDIFESDVIQQLKDLGIVYAEIFDTFADYPNVNKDDVIDALKSFLKAYKDEDTTADDFLTYTDDFLTFRSSFGNDDAMFNLYEQIPNDIRNVNVFTDAYNSYIADDETEDFIDYYKNYYNQWG